MGVLATESSPKIVICCNGFLQHRGKTQGQNTGAKHKGKIMSDHIGYGELIEGAMLGVAKKALQFVQNNGLPYEHHFYITFLTQTRGVEIPAFLQQAHPYEMTIVLQNQFWNLVVTDTAFSVDLSFRKQRYTLTIPFESLVSFNDPSVQFSLHFNMTMMDEEQGTSIKQVSDGDQQAEVISLDAFRKKRKPEQE